MKHTLLFFLALLCMPAMHAQTTNYCTPSTTQTGKSPFYTHFLEVHIGDMSHILSAPFTTTSTTYEDYTSSQQAELIAGYTYPMSLLMGNGGNTQTVAVWIDYNGNNVFESGERLLSQTDYANVGNHWISFNVAVPANAKAGKTRMRVGTKYGTATPDPCTNNAFNDWSQHFLDYTINIVSGDVQVYKGASAGHPDLREVTAGSSGNMILQVVVETNTNGSLSPQAVSELTFGLVGTTNPGDVTGAKLYYTGKSPRFATTQQYGSAVSKPSTYFNFTGNQKLHPGKNYFWLTYDVSSTAILGNAIDARLANLTIDGSKRAPSVVSPSGSRSIGYCISRGNKNVFIYVLSASFADVGVTSYNSFDGYSNFTWMSDTFFTGMQNPISVQVGNGVNDNYTRAWIDFNRDGDFSDAGEMVMFDSLINLSQTNVSYGPVDTVVTVPSTAKWGPTRMRITSNYRAITGPLTPPPTCGNPFEIGETEDYTVILADTGQPVAEFFSTTACLGGATFFTDRSYVFGTDTVSSWSWKFGDGNTSTLPNPTHTYTKAGVYTVSLTVTSSKSGSTPSTIEKAVVVNAPVAAFSQYGQLKQTPVLFADETTGGVVISWQWDFGDPASGVMNQSFSESPSHTFDTAGTYNVQLIVTTAGGCRDTIIQKVKIEDVIAPEASFNASTYNPYRTAKVSLIDQSLYSPASWKWTFSPNTVTFHDNTSDTSRNPVVSFNNLNTYKVTLTVSNAAGSDTISRFFVTRNYSAPVSAFSAAPTLVRAGQLVSFLDESKNDPTQWKWQFGNGDTSSKQHPIYQYPLPGTYTVKLDVSNPAGSDNEQKLNYITVGSFYRMCETDATWSPLFSGRITDSGDSTNNYGANSNCGFLIKPPCSGPITLTFSQFDYGDGDFLQIFDGEDEDGKPLQPQFSNGFTGSNLPAKITATSGALYIKEVTDFFSSGSGFVANWSAVPNIKPKAVVDAPDTGYVNSYFTFTNKTVLGTANSYYWDYDGDGVYDAINPTAAEFIYTIPGTYTVKMLAENCKGKDSLTKTVIIKQPTTPPVAAFLYKDTVDVLEWVYITDRSNYGPQDWSWIVTGSHYFIQGTSPKSRNPIILFDEPGAYTISLIPTNNIGQGQKLTKTIYVRDRRDLCGESPSEAFTVGKFYDSGGPLSDYGNNESCRITFPYCGRSMTMDFKYFEMANGDYLRVYDGFDNTGQPLHSGLGFTAFSQPGMLVSRSGFMYIEIQTNAGTTAKGWEAHWRVEPFDAPKAVITGPDTVYSGIPAAYYSSSTGLITKMYWDFNQDNTPEDSAEDAQYIYTQNFTHQRIRLVVYSCGTTDTAYKDVYVRKVSDYPKADFLAEERVVTTSDFVRFRDLSTWGPHNRHWSFNPDSITYIRGSSSYPNPIVQFNEPGMYDVSLWVRNLNGEDSIRRTDYIKVIEYCRPMGVPVVNIGISRVRLHTLNYTSNTGAGDYQDYTRSGPATELEVRGNYALTIGSPNIQNYVRKAWIDYNQNGVFEDSTEMVGDVTSFTDSAVMTFIVPKYAQLGRTRLRVMSVINMGGNKNSCEGTMGEFEDYTIIIIPDTEPPVITLKGKNPDTVEIGSSYIDPGATAMDVVNGDLTSQIIVTGAVDTSTVGVYTLHYNVTDSAGNPAKEVVRTVRVVNDMTPPVLTLLGDNPMIVAVFHSYVEPGATAIDSRDGDVSDNVSIVDNVDTAVINIYDVIYTAYDESGNASVPQIRKVHVVDTVAPVVTLNGLDTIRIKQFSTFTDPGATAQDNYYTAGVSMKVTGTVNPNVIGTYTLTYTATDPSGNVSPGTVRVVIVEELVSIGNALPGVAVKVYPVPATEYIYLTVELATASPVMAELLNMQGQVIYLQNQSSAMDYHSFSFAAYDLQAGMYLLRIRTPEGIMVRQVQVVR